MALINVKKQSLNDLKVSIKKKLLSVQNDRKSLKEVAEFSVDRIKSFARRGKPLRSLKFGRPGKFPILSDLTPAFRRNIAKSNPTHKTYGKSGRKRNLTITGQLIEGTMFKIKRNVISIFVGGRRRKYRGANGKKIDGPTSNKQLFKELVDRNKRYNFLGMDRLGFKRIKNMMKRNLRRLLRQ